MTAAGARLVAGLYRLRRRGYVVGFARAGASTLAGAVMVGAVIVASGGRLPSPLAAGAIGALGLAAAAAWTVARRPGLRATAALVDRSLGLEQQVETACELCEDGDEISVRLREQAVAALDRLDPGVIFPLRSGSRRGALPLLVAGWIVLLLLARSTGLWWARSGSSGASSGLPTSFGALEEGAAGDAGERGQLAGAVSGDAGTGDIDPGAVEPRTPDAGAVRPLASSAVESAPWNGEGAGPSESTTTTDEASAPRAADGAAGAALGDDPAGAVSPAGEAPASGVQPTGAASGGPGPAAGAAAAVASIRLRATPSGAGGATGGAGPLGSAFPGSVDDAPDDRRWREAVGAELPGAVESAIAREDLPPRLREYLRRYFLALSSEDGR